MIKKLLDALFERALGARSFGAAFFQLWMDLLFLVLAALLTGLLPEAIFSDNLLRSLAGSVVTLFWLFGFTAVLIPDAAVLAWRVIQKLQEPESRIG